MKRSMAQRHRSGITSDREPGFGRMLALSVLLHVLTVVFVSGVMFTRAPVPERLSYKVNLVNRPVEQPRRGHSAAAPEKKVSAPAPRQAPAAAKPASKPAPKPAPKPEAVPKPATVPKPAPKPEAVKKVEVPAPAPAKIKTPEQNVTPTPKAEVPPAPKVAPQPLQPMLSAAEIERIYQQDTHARIDEIRRENEASARIEQLKRQLAAQATAQSPTTTTVSTETVGSASGTGTQAGIAFEEWIMEYLAQHWTLPLTHRKKGLRSTVVLRFDAQGNRTGYTMLIASGDSLFDQSVEQCVLSLQTLPAPPSKSRSFTIIFDPNEMLKK